MLCEACFFFSQSIALSVASFLLYHQYRTKEVFERVRVVTKVLCAQIPSPITQVIIILDHLKMKKGVYYPFRSSSFNFSTNFPLR